MTGELSALATAILWSFTSVVFTFASRRLGNTLLNVARLAMASVLLGATILLLGISLEISSLQTFLLVISGIIGLVIGDTYLFKAFTEIGPRNSMMLMAFNPALATIMAFFTFGEKISGWGITGICITMIGITFVITQKHDEETAVFRMTGKGIIYGLIGAMGQAGGLIFAKYANNHGSINPLLASFVRIFSATIILLVISTLAKKISHPFVIFKNDKKALGLTFLGSIIGPYMGISLSYVAIINTQIGIASTIMSTIPIFMLPISHYIFKEKLSIISIVGAFVTVGGIAVLFLMH